MAPARRTYTATCRTMNIRTRDTMITAKGSLTSSPRTLCRNLILGEALIAPLNWCLYHEKSQHEPQVTPFPMPVDFPTVSLMLRLVVI